MSKHSDAGDVSLLSAIRNIEHFDIEPDVPLGSDDVDALIQQELNLDENPCEGELDITTSLQERSFPYTP